MIKQMFKSQKGANMTIVAIMLSIVFIVILNGVIDVANSIKIKKRLNAATTAAARSASSKYDESQVPYGKFLLDSTKAENTYIDILSSNLGVTLTKVGNYYQYTNPDNGNRITCYIFIYNNIHKGTFIQKPDVGTVPSQVTDSIIQVNMDRPTVYSIVTQEYKVSPIFVSRLLKFKKTTAAQINAIPQDRQKSATYN